MIRVLSPFTISQVTFFCSTSNACLLSSALGCIISVISLSMAFKLNSRSSIFIFPLSILDMSRISLIRSSRCMVDIFSLRRCSRIFSGSARSYSIVRIVPVIAFIGSADFVAHTRQKFPLRNICVLCTFERGPEHILRAVFLGKVTRHKYELGDPAVFSDRITPAGQLFS